MTREYLPSLAASIAALSLCATPSLSHEFWLEPEIRTVELGETLSVDMLVGQDFVGTKLPYLPDTVQSMLHWSPVGGQTVNARIGDIPVMQNTLLDQQGLHRFSLATNPAYIVFDDLAEFTDYLTYEGLEDVVALHRQRGLPDAEIAESYIRNARTLIQVGPATADQIDTPTGMPFEIVALANPFLDGLTSFDVSLTWQNAPVANAQISVFHRPEGAEAAQDTTRHLLITYDQGRARLSLNKPGSYLLNAVRIDPVKGPGSVVWQSHWASLTFQIPAQ
jgi:uncharacterized GH25 family protein